MSKFLNISTDTNLGGNSASDDTVSSQKAVKAYVDSQTGTAPAFANITGQPTDNANLATALAGKVPTSRTINSKALTSNITLTASDVGALPSSTVIPTVNNATLTIQKNGTTVNTFTANASSNVTANITVPTKTSDLTNDDGFITGITSSDVTTALGYTPVNPSNLATVATSGSYNDLSNKPTIPAAQVNSDWNASSGVAQILNKPTLGTMASESASDYTPTSGLATVATTGAYSDLSGTPTIPTVDQTYDGTSTNAQSGVAVAQAISGKADSATTLSGYGITDGANTDLSNLTSTGKSYASGLGMPSSRYIDLTLGASGATYTAPANGYISMVMADTVSGTMGYFSELYDNGVEIRRFGDQSTSGAYHVFALNFEISKGQTFNLYYYGSAPNFFRFIYAEGENV